MTGAAIASWPAELALLEPMTTHAELDAWWLPRAVAINRLSVTDWGEWLRVSNAVEAARTRVNFQ